MKKLLIVCLFIAAGVSVHAQERFWVFFTDKGEETTCRLASPETFLSSMAIAKKSEKGIEITESDLPVHAAYVDALEARQLEVVSTSRWLNAAVVEAPFARREEVETLGFVRETRRVYTLVSNRSAADPEDLQQWMGEHLPKQGTNVFDYGEASIQNTMINIQALHNKGFSGRGVRVALFDSGFDGVDTVDAFDSLWVQNRVIAWYDFVDKDTTVFRSDSHGTQVLSTIAANLSGEMIGTAPHASFLLCRTEDARSETQQEEHNWVAAVEWADSMGADVIHSSLGYSEFDDDEDSYTYDDMDGNTAIITRAADMAASKGIIVTTSAGNEGTDSWHYITAPCDGDSVLCVGAVTRTGKRSSFSSFGPAADGRIKPDVVALGSNTTVASPRNYITSSQGTSFSGPIIAGMVACLRQAHPKRSNMDIIQAVRLSSDQFDFPDDEYGYGIPNAGMADSLLSNVQDLSSVVIGMAQKPDRGTPKKPKEEKKIEFAANPRSTVNVGGNAVTVDTGNASLVTVEVMFGKQKVTLDPADMVQEGNQQTISTKYLIEGEYYLHIVTGDYEENVKFSK